MTYSEKHDALVAYLKVKVEERDWHGVSDVANDLRVLEAKPPGPPVMLGESVLPMDHRPGQVKFVTKAELERGWKP